MNSKRRRKIKARLGNAAGGGRKCFYCTRLMIPGHNKYHATVEHIYPVQYRNGPGYREVVKLACCRCNQHRAASFCEAEKRYGLDFVSAYLRKAVEISLSAPPAVRTAVLWPSWEYRYGGRGWTVGDIIAEIRP